MCKLIPYPFCTPLLSWTKPRHCHAVFPSPMKPPTSPCPTLSAHTEPISQAHCQMWHESLMLLMHNIEVGMRPQTWSFGFVNKKTQTFFPLKVLGLSWDVSRKRFGSFSSRSSVIPSWELIVSRSTRNPYYTIITISRGTESLVNVRSHGWKCWPLYTCSEALSEQNDIHNS